jgi:hypothetical protein
MEATYWSMDECCWVSWSPDRPAAEADDAGPVDTTAIPAQLAEAERRVST